jgi:signal transduction histidine kinase
MMSAVCHDLRSPLSSIMMGSGFLQRSLSKIEGMDTERRILEGVLRSAQRLASLVSDLHDATKLEAGELVLERNRLSVASLLEAAVAAAREAAAKQGVSLVSRPSPSATFIMGDRARLLQALGELVENALRYSPAASTVLIEAELVDGNVTFSVIDEGPGMRPDQRAHAFDPYWHASQSPRDGTGLGLALVHGIATLHGGGARIDALERGTSAVFWLAATA